MIPASAEGMAFGRNILLLIPHPDDEIVGCAAAIARARAQGARVSGLYLTHGCIPREQLWPWQRRKLRDYERRVNDRLREAEIAAHIMRIDIRHLERVRAARELWQQLPAVHALIEDAIRTLRPDAIWTPAYEGGNPDHDGLNGLAACLAGRDADIKVYEFSEYNCAQGRVAAPGFPAPNGTEITLDLSPEEIAEKQRLLGIYITERKNLGYFRTPAREILRPLAGYDYSKPPHPGKVFYARHQWVPFRHPRVDYTQPDDVCTAIRELQRAIAGT